MKSIFAQGPVYGYRFLLAVMVSVALMAADLNYREMDLPRQWLGYLVSPVHWVVNAPLKIIDWTSTTFATRDQLLQDNAKLNAQILVLERKSQQLAILQAENVRLRELLNASKLVNESVLAAEIIGIDPDPFTHQVIINKGQQDGIFKGQPLLDSGGLMGQIVNVDTFSSRALLVADSNHAVPVQVNRNGVRAIAVGTGNLSELELIYVPDTADIKVGDLLITSGLGEKFPSGYPVALVTQVEHDPGQAFAKVKARPTAELNQSKNVLMVFAADNTKEEDS